MRAVLSAVSLVEEREAEVLLVLGGDGFLLDTLHRLRRADLDLPLFGLNRGTTGFLLNRWRQDLGGLADRVAAAVTTQLVPLRMTARTSGGKEVSALAYNEVALRRLGQQTAHIRISVDGVVRLEPLVGDGVLLATPAGSPAYNASAGGPILPITGGVCALTPVAPLRPRRWTGALLPRSSELLFEVLDPDKRPVAVTADQRDLTEVVEVRVSQDGGSGRRLLFDRDARLEDRMLDEQFGKHWGT